MWFIETYNHDENVERGNISWIRQKVTHLKAISKHNIDNQFPLRKPLGSNIVVVSSKSNTQRHSPPRPNVSTTSKENQQRSVDAIKPRSSVLVDWTETIRQKLGKEKFDTIIHNKKPVELVGKDKSVGIHLKEKTDENVGSCKNCLRQREEQRLFTAQERSPRVQKPIRRTSSASPPRRESNNFKDIELDDDHGDNEAAVLRTIASELPDFENASPHMGFFKGLWGKDGPHKERPNPNELDPGTSFIRLTPPNRLRAPERLTGEEQIRAFDKSSSFQGKISDYEKTAQSCLRKNKLQGAARAFFCAGVICDNIQDYPRAQENYENMITACIKADDYEGQACAYNALGCSLQECQIVKIKGVTKRMVPSRKEMEAVTESLLQYERALQAHTKHSEVGDTAGNFVAFTNMGFVATKLAFYHEAVQSHRRALKCATEMEDLYKQGISLGNLGFLFFKREKYLAARACLSRYLQVCQILDDEAGQARAHFTLGNVASQLGRYIEARAEFRSSLKIARRIGYEQILVYANIQIDIVEGYIKSSGRRASFETFNPPIDLSDVL